MTDYEQKPGMIDYEDVRRQWRLWCFQPLRKVDWELVLGLGSAALLVIAFWVVVYVYWRA